MTRMEFIQTLRHELRKLPPEEIVAATEFFEEYFDDAMESLDMTGLSEEDAEHIKNALVSLFENDVSSARPEGSVEMTEFYWIVHPNKSGKVSSAKIHRSVKAQKKEGVTRARELADYDFDDSELKSIDGLKIEHYREGELVS